MYINRKIVMGKPMFIGIMVLIFVLTLVAINSKVATNQFIETYAEKLPDMENRIASLETQNDELLKNIHELETQNDEYEKTLNILQSQVNLETTIETVDISKDTNISAVQIDKNLDIPSNKRTMIKQPTDDRFASQDIELPEEEIDITTSTVEDIVDEAVNIEINLTNISQKSNLSTEQFNKVIFDTMTKYGKTESEILNTGEYLKYIEDTFNVNGLFALSVASLESGWGQRHPNNNLFGLGSGSMYFEVDGESINYFGKLIRECYIDNGLTNIDAISGKYCPPNSNKWAGDIYWFMGVYGDAANKILIE